MRETENDITYSEVFHKRDSNFSFLAKDSNNITKNKNLYAFNTLFSNIKIEPTEECKQLLNRERFIINLCLLVMVIFGPLLFRYVMGSPLSEKVNIHDFKWGSDIDGVEWYVLMVLFFGMMGNIYRLLPQFCGGPTAVESSQKCVLEGRVSLGCCSPFCSEDDAILLRSFIGRTSTIFHTCGTSRHKLEGLYFDAILNERRLKGENNRIFLWESWMKFLETLVALCHEMKETNKTNRYSNIQRESKKRYSQSSVSSSHQQLPHSLRRNSIRSNFIPPTPIYQEANELDDEDNATLFSSHHVSSKKITLDDLAYFAQSTFDQDLYATPATYHQNGELRRTFGRLSSRNIQIHSNDDNHNGNSYEGENDQDNDQFDGNGNGNLELKKHILNKKNSNIDSNSNPISSQQTKNENLKRKSQKKLHSQESIDETTLPPLTPNDVSKLKPMTIDWDSIEPLVQFIDCWLDEVKSTEWTYNFDDKNDVIEEIFFAAPFMDHFHGPALSKAYTALKTLRDAFLSYVSDDIGDPHYPIHCDRSDMVEWIIKRPNLPDWTICWCIASRARLIPMKREKCADNSGPEPRFECTRIKPGAIVYEFSDVTDGGLNLVRDYFLSRQKIFKVVSVDGNNISVTSWPPNPDLPQDYPRRLSLDNVALLEKNRGKTGALNFFADYLRVFTLEWLIRKSCHMAANPFLESDMNGHGHNNRPHFVSDDINKSDNPLACQVLVGIVDARHMLTEPKIFWNDALPYFSTIKDTMEPSRSFGMKSTHPVCITVQYPQYFSNVLDDDYLDNSNSTYYNLWQTLRDGAKCITSSGTNAIWDITKPDFEFCTTTRSEDLGTSHKYIPNSVSVYLCIYVAYGIAKKTEDFLEALYRWAAGPLELFWLSWWNNEIQHHFIVAIPTTIAALASFAESGWWYVIYLIMIGGFLAMAIVDKMHGRKPLRSFCVSTVIAINLWNNACNLLSITWFVIFPGRIAFWGKMPLGQNDKRAMFWGFVSIFFALPTGIFVDALIRMARHTAPATKDLNYHHTLWRGTQLYSASFMYTLLSTIAGSYSAFKAWWYDMDLSMWASFRVKANEFDKIWAQWKTQNPLQSEWWNSFYTYMSLSSKSMIANLTMPTFMTKWYVTFVFLFQIVAIGTSTFIVNRNDMVYAAVVLFVCTLNLMLITEITILMQPGFTHVFGWPIRSEFVFGWLGVLIIVSGIANGALDASIITDRLRIPHLH